MTNSFIEAVGLVDHLSRDQLLDLRAILDRRLMVGFPSKGRGRGNTPGSVRGGRGVPPKGPQEPKKISPNKAWTQWAQNNPGGLAVAVHDESAWALYCAANPKDTDRDFVIERIAARADRIAKVRGAAEAAAAAASSDGTFQSANEDQEVEEEEQQETEESAAAPPPTPGGGKEPPLSAVGGFAGA